MINEGAEECFVGDKEVGEEMLEGRDVGGEIYVSSSKGGLYRNGMLTHLFCVSSEHNIWRAHTNFRGFHGVLTKHIRTHISQFCYFPTLQRDIEKSGFEFLFGLTS